MTKHDTVMDERLARGTQLLQQIGGVDYAGPTLRLAELSPDMAALTIAFPYGEVLSRPGLDLRRRQLCTVSTLIALGSAQPQLRFHMDGLLNVGGTVQDLVEILVLSTAILGFPAAIDAIGILRTILQERGIEYTPEPGSGNNASDRHIRGVDSLMELLGEDQDSYTATFQKVSPALAHFAVDFAFGEVLSREGLDRSAKQLAVITMLATVGNRAELLRAHIRGAISGGTSREEVIETLIQLSVYAGFPTALNAFAAAKQVFDEPCGAPTAVSQNSDITSYESHAKRRKRGLATLKATSGGTGDAVVHSFDDIAPEIGALIVDHSYGEIFCRPGLDPKIRELTACAVLAGSLTAASEIPLRVHVVAALNVGATAQEIVETLLNVAAYRGYPAVQRAMAIAGEEFSKRVSEKSLCRRDSVEHEACCGNLDQRF